MNMSPLQQAGRSFNTRSWRRGTNARTPWQCTCTKSRAGAGTRTLGKHDTVAVGTGTVLLPAPSLRLLHAERAYTAEREVVVSLRGGAFDHPVLALLHEATWQETMTLQLGWQVRGEVRLWPPQCIRVCNFVAKCKLLLMAALSMGGLQRPRMDSMSKPTMLQSASMDSISAAQMSKGLTTRRLGAAYYAVPAIEVRCIGDLKNLNL